MNDIKTRIDKIFEKYGEYTSFDYSKSRNSGTDEIVEHWNLYTPTKAQEFDQAVKDLLDYLNIRYMRGKK